MQGSVTLGRAEHQVGDAAALGLQLALAGQPVPPRGAQVLVGSGHATEADVSHLLARLGVPAVIVEVGGGLLLGAPYSAQHLERLASVAGLAGLARLIVHSQVPSRCPGPDSNSRTSFGRPRIKRSLIGAYRGAVAGQGQQLRLMVSALTVAAHS